MYPRIFFALLTLASFNAFASGYQADIDEFFEAYSRGSVDEAIDGLYASNRYVSAVPDQIINVKNQLRGLQGLVGAINLKRKIAEHSVGELFVHVTYLVTFDRQPIRFEFQFFRVNDGWRIYSMSFDDDIDDDIEAAAREKAVRGNG